MIKVVICGAGPTGLTLACLLQNANIKVTLLEKELHSSSYTKALMIHAGSLEIMNQLDLADTIINCGIKQNKIIFHIAQDRDYVIDFSNLKTTQFPFYINLTQPSLEAILEKKFLSLGGEILRGCELKRFSQKENSVCIKYHQNDETKKIRSDYLVACDGASSSIREMLGITFSGNTYSFPYVLAEGYMEHNISNDYSAMYINDNVVFSVLPMENGQFRVAGPGSMDEKADELSQTEFEHLLVSNNLEKLRLKTYSSLRTYNVSERVADNMICNRVILCGDAGHIHSPSGGQAMNLGIADAFSLYWRFLNPADTSSLLCDFENERIKIANSVVQSTHLFDRVNIMRFGNEEQKSDLTNLIEEDSKIFSQLFHHVNSLNPLNDRTLSIGARIPDIPISKNRSTWNIVSYSKKISIDPNGLEWQRVLANYFNLNQAVDIKIRQDMYIESIWQ